MKRKITIETVNKSTGEYDIQVSNALDKETFHKWMMHLEGEMFPDNDDVVCITVDSSCCPVYHEGNLVFV